MTTFFPFPFAGGRWLLGGARKSEASRPAALEWKSYPIRGQVRRGEEGEEQRDSAVRLASTLFQLNNGYGGTDETENNIPLPHERRILLVCRHSYYSPAHLLSARDPNKARVERLLSQPPPYNSEHE